MCRVILPLRFSFFFFFILRYAGGRGKKRCDFTGGRFVRRCSGLFGMTCARRRSHQSINHCIDRPTRTCQYYPFTLVSRSPLNDARLTVVQYRRRTSAIRNGQVDEKINK